MNIHKYFRQIIVIYLIITFLLRFVNNKNLRKNLQHIDELQYKYDEALVSNINNYDRFDKMVKVGRWLLNIALNEAKINKKFVQEWYWLLFTKLLYLSHNIIRHRKVQKICNCNFEGKCVTVVVSVKRVKKGKLWELKIY